MWGILLQRSFGVLDPHAPVRRRGRPRPRYSYMIRRARALRQTLVMAFKTGNATLLAGDGANRNATARRGATRVSVSEAQCKFISCHHTRSQNAMYGLEAPHSKRETNKPSSSTQRLHTTGWPLLYVDVTSRVTKDSPSQYVVTFHETFRLGS